jgi:hypothetical protein
MNFRSRLHARLKGLTVALALLVLTLFVAGPVLAARSYSNTGSFGTFSGYTDLQFGGNNNNDYRHVGHTYGHVYGGGPPSSIRTRVTSLDERDNYEQVCNQRVEDSGDVLGVYSVTRVTPWASVLPCTGRTSHGYHGYTEHYYSGQWYTSTSHP